MIELRFKLSPSLSAVCSRASADRVFDPCLRARWAGYNWYPAGAGPAQFRDTPVPVSPSKGYVT